MGNGMAQHVKIVGVLHIIFGSLGLFAAVVVLMVFGGIAGLVGATDQSDDRFVAMPVLGIIGLIAFIVLLVLSLPGLIGGVGLLYFKPWARILVIVLSALDLFSVPFGTALGIYGLWALLNRDAERLFQQQGVAGPFRAAG
jgi:hypothetical protein